MKRTLIIPAVMVFFLIMLAGYYQSQQSARPVNEPVWDQQAYIWQRIWTPEHREALSQSHKLFSGLRILGLQLNSGDGLHKIAVDTQMLKQDGRPVWLVVRLDGQLQHIDHALVYNSLLSQLQQWQQAGLSVRGVEIDYDAPSSKLLDYQRFIQLLRTKLSQNLQLSVTALPTWIDSPDLPALLQQVDISVLQVHAVLSPEKGLFDPGHAAGWIERYSRLTAKPFYVALPAYGMGLAGYDGSNPLVESEAPVNIAGQMQELSVEPQKMADFLSQLKQRSPTLLQGLVWFRLPLESDRRAWSMATLKAVTLQQPLSAQWSVDVQLQPAQSAQANSLYNLVLRNTGQTDGVFPQEIILPEGQCQIGDAVGNYQLNPNNQPLRFIRTHSQQLRAGQSQAFGWARCTHLGQGVIHVKP